MPKFAGTDKTGGLARKALGETTEQYLPLTSVCFVLVDRISPLRQDEESKDCIMKNLYCNFRRGSPVCALLKFTKKKGTHRCAPTEL